ncbi:uncharacterized protein ARMOST_14731 [Armillaria ostoyae]|uniref:Uncharacterized protein n=1 Tax=Armillaria ostoyae TaxID=47428 RepID=A0A284RRI5_ARMOS|nr:uncharacterized protein ARMOST_14731 [Armillaria ostoyae]
MPTLVIALSGYRQLPPKFALRAISIRAQNMNILLMSVTPQRKFKLRLAACELVFFNVPLAVSLTSS